jgi:dedicator of cytokinesis protein 1
LLLLSIRFSTLFLLLLSARSDRNRALKGIFPKSYVHLIAATDVEIVKNVYVIKRSEIVDEITTILKEWHDHFKKFFLVSRKHFPIALDDRAIKIISQQTSNSNLKVIREKMLELIKLRAQMLSGNLPVDEMKDLKLKASSEIDTGNKLLGKVANNFARCLD